MARHKVFYLKHTLRMHSTSLPEPVEEPIIQLLPEAAYYSKIIHEYLAQAYM